MDSLFQSDRNLTEAIGKLRALRLDVVSESGFAYMVLDHALDHLYDQRDIVKRELGAYFGRVEVARA